MNDNLSEKERQEIFLDAYRKAVGRKKTIKEVCDLIEMPRHQFDIWLADPEFEEQFWALRRAHSYELEEQLSSISHDLLQEGETISKSRFYALQIAQKSVLELIGKLNRERFGESQEIRLKQEGNVQPAINITLISADVPAINIDQKKEAIEAPSLLIPVKESDEIV